MFVHPLAFQIIIAAVAWAILYSLVQGRLRAQHPALNASLVGWGRFKFILLREHRDLGDRRLSTLSDIALLYFIPYAGFFAYVVYMYPRSAT